MYLVRSSGKKRGKDVIVVNRVSFRYDRKRKATGRVIGGLFTEVEDIGADKSRFRILGYLVTQDASGQPREMTESRNWGYAEATAAGVKKVVRILRGQEAEVLAEYDAKIADLERQVRIAKSERQEFLQTAFGKGNVVPLKEAIASAEDRK